MLVETLFSGGKRRGVVEIHTFKIDAKNAPWTNLALQGYDNVLI